MALIRPYFDFDPGGPNGPRPESPEPPKRRNEPQNFGALEIEKERDPRCWD